jgi:NAD(P)-dependent dehydrogenase (short-subunit alcohol dehydrogenase family)/aryl carrier-like protein
VLSLSEQQVEIEPLPSPVQQFHPDATYLLTGGLGGLGLEVAQWMVERGARHLVLVGRSQPSQAVRSRLETIEQRFEAQITALQADITLGQDVASVLGHIERRLPPLRGIIHAAAVLDDGTLLHLDRARLRTVMAPKILGAWHLDRQTRHLPLDFFVCFSSAAGLLGSPGQGNYCAANTFLDTFAHERRAQGLSALSIDWGAWAQVGLAAAQANRGQRIAVRGIQSFTPQEGLQALEWLLAERRPQMAFLPFDLVQWQQFYPMAEQASIFSHLVARERQDEPDTRQTALLDDLLRGSHEERLAALETYLGERLAKILGYKQATLDPSLPLHQLGLDSLMALEWRNVVKRDLGVQIAVKDLFQRTSIRQVAGRVLEELSYKVSQPVSEGSMKENNQ